MLTAGRRCRCASPRAGSRSRCSSTACCGRSAPGELSDGTLRYLLWVAALLTPRPPELLVLNEPETSLHPDLLPALGRLIQQASTRSQVIVVSHAAGLIDALQSQSELPRDHAVEGLRRHDGRRLARAARAGSGRPAELSRPAEHDGMRLVLVHHADAVGPEVDPQRPLSMVGRFESSGSRGGAVQGVKPAVIWHSGKLRARQTAEAFWKACNPFAELKATAVCSHRTALALRDVLVGEERDLWRSATCRACRASSRCSAPERGREPRLPPAWSGGALARPGRCGRRLAAAVGAAWQPAAAPPRAQRGE